MARTMLLPLVGLFAGGLGTLIGGGGGFLLVPALLALLPDRPPGIITGISQTVILLNALSGSVAYARQGRIAYRWGLALALAGSLGMVLGALVTEGLSRSRFEAVFGLAVLPLSLYLLVRPTRGPAPATNEGDRVQRPPLGPRWLSVGVAFAFASGTLGGLLGIGGGLVLVPALVQALRFPAHVATATSQFVIFLTSPAAIAVHAASVPLAREVVTVLLLGVGVILGAQVGARLSKRFSAPWLIRTLALALMVLGVRLVAKSGIL